jgi:predicted component of type VI protein secretion system
MYIILVTKYKRGKKMKKTVKRIALVAVLVLTVVAMATLLVACSAEGDYTLDKVEIKVEFLGEAKTFLEAAGQPTSVNETITKAQLEDESYEPSASIENYLEFAEVGLEGNFRVTATDFIFLYEDGTESEEKQPYKIEGGKVVFTDENGEAVDNPFGDSMSVYFSMGNLIMEFNLTEEDTQGVVKGSVKVIFKKM